MSAADKAQSPEAWPSSRTLPPTLRRCVALVVSLLYFLLRRHNSRSKVRLVILYYHSTPRDYRARFVAQLERIVAGADRVVPADFNEPTPSGQLLVAITFDDGFVSVAEHAIPELSARGLPATIFVPSGMLGRPPGWEMAEYAEGRTETIMTAEQLRAVAGDSIEIGSHTVSHPFLTAIDPQVADREISLSRRSLTEAVGRDVDLFSFPYGDHDTQTVRFCRLAGYRFAFTSDPACIDPTAAEFVRGRTVIRPDETQAEFWLKMRGAYVWQSRVRAARHRLMRLLQKPRAHARSGIPTQAAS